MKKRFFVLLAAIGVAAVILPATALTAKSGQVVQKVPVKMTEFNFASSKLKPASFGEASILKPGKTRFVFNNSKANVPHNFTIFYRSEGATDFNSATLDPGKKQRKTIDLRPGSYVAVCTVFNGAHAAAGMIINFTVGQQSSDDGSWG